MYERVKRLYAEGKISEEGINNAVTKGWITEEQAQEILNPSDDETVD